MTAVPTSAPSGFATVIHHRFLSLATSFAALAVALLLAGQEPVRAQSPGRSQPNPFKASVSQASHDDAVRSIPFDKLDAESRGLINAVLADVTIFRRMPVRVIQCDPELYLFLVNHPDVVVNIWEVLQLSQITLRQTEPDTYILADSAGTNGTVRYLYRSSDTHLMYAEGTYDGPLTGKPLRGRGLLILKTGYIREADGRCYITTRLDSFMQVEPGGAEILTKAFQPLVGKIADLNFLQTAAFVGSLSRTAEVNGPGMRRLASRLTAVQPEVRSQFALLTEQVAQKATGLTVVAPESEHATLAQRPGQTTTK